jgi:CubicO group peptidase (beta-lactamase class C family)
MIAANASGVSSVTRRGAGLWITGWLALAAVALAAASGAAARPGGSADGPPTVSPGDITFSNDTLHPGLPRRAGLLRKWVSQLLKDAESYLVPTPDHPKFPAYPGGVLLAAKDGVIVKRAAFGQAVRYSAVGPPPALTGVELPADQQIPARLDTIYDIASMSKLFTETVALQLVESKQLDLAAPVASYIPAFAANGKEAITVRMLLTHTSGLLPDPVPPLWTYSTIEEKNAAILATALAPGATVGGQYIYSDVGLMTLALLIEQITGQPLDQLVRERITQPLGMANTGYNPPPELQPQIAATEYETWVGRGMVWGQVHDENAWALDGVAGHAGVFSTARDLATFCQMWLNGGRYGGVRILRASTVRRALVNYNADIPHLPPDGDRGLGWQLDSYNYMGPMSSPVTYGHTGFTGTSFVMDPLSNSFLIFLANRVHPTRNWGANTVARQELARDLSYAMPVRPLQGRTAWRARGGNGGTATLTYSLPELTSDGSASFQFWYDTNAPFDKVRFATSSNNGATWSPAPMTLSWSGDNWTADGSVAGYGGRQWWRVSAELPDGTTDLRWSYITNGTAQGRGVYVDRLRVDGDQVGPPEADGWTRAAD